MKTGSVVSPSHPTLPHPLPPRIYFWLLGLKITLSDYGVSRPSSKKLLVQVQETRVLRCLTSSKSGLPARPAETCKYQPRLTSSVFKMEKTLYGSTSPLKLCSLVMSLVSPMSIGPLFPHHLLPRPSFSLPPPITLS